MNGWIIYLLVAISISLTSYITIYKPALELYIDIIEERNIIQNSILGKFLWIILGTVLAPFVGIALLSGKNSNIIRRIVLTWLGSDDE